MELSDSTPGVPPDAVRELISELDEPATPLTTGDVAERSGLTERIAEQGLSALPDRGELRTGRGRDLHVHAARHR